MAAHPFLSDEWVEASRAIHAEFADRVTPPSEVVRMNVTVIDAPFDDGEVLGHVDTTAGSVIPAQGHLAHPDVAIRVPYQTARMMLIDQRFDELMIAFMSGEVEVEGDVTLMMSISEINPTAAQQALADEVGVRLREITT